MPASLRSLLSKIRSVFQDSSWHACFLHIQNQTPLNVFSVIPKSPAIWTFAHSDNAKGESETITGQTCEELSSLRIKYMESIKLYFSPVRNALRSIVPADSKLNTTA